MDTPTLIGTGLFILGAVVWVVCAIYCYRMAPTFGRSAGLWAVLGVIFGPIALMILYVLPKHDPCPVMERARARTRRPPSTRSPTRTRPGPFRGSVCASRGRRPRARASIARISPHENRERDVVQIGGHHARSCTRILTGWDSCEGTWRSATLTGLFELAGDRQVRHRAHHRAMGQRDAVVQAGSAYAERGFGVG